MIFFKKPLNFNRIIALCLAIIIHIILLVFIYFDHQQNKHPNNFIELTIIKKSPIPTVKKINKPKVKSKKRTKKTTKKYFTVIDSIVVKDTTKILQSDSNSILSKIDSFIIANPNITVLKIDAKEKLKSFFQKKSNEEITKRKITNAMNNYYKAKYPTPPYKFGERGTGNLINIPIDEIIKLFK